MADLTKTIEILFEGTNRTGTVITSVGRELDELNYRVGTVAQPFADLTAAVGKLDAALGALAVAGLAVAYRESTKFESSYIELKKVVGDNVGGLEAAKRSAIELSDAYGESSSSILESTAAYVQAGFNVDEAMKLAKSGMDLVIAGGIDAAQSSEILVAALKGFDEPASEAARLIDILNEVSNNFATDTEQLGIGMAALSPIAKAMGLSMEETAGVLTPVIEVFRSGDEAAVALKTGLLKLIDDSEPVKNALASIGVSQRDANGELRSGKDILHDVQAAFQDLNQDQKLFVTQQLVGINQSARMVTVFDNLAKTTAVTETALNSMGSASLEVAERLKSSEVALNRWSTGLQNAAIAVGDKFRVSATEATNGMTDIWNAVRESVNAGDFDELFDALDAFGRDLAETFRNIAKNIPEAMAGVDFSGLLDSLGGFRRAVAGLFDGIDFSKAEDVQALAQKVVDSFESLARFSTGVAEVFVMVARKVSDLIDRFNSLDGDTKELFGTLSGFGSVISLMTGPMAGLASAITGVGSVMKLMAVGQVASLTKSLVGPGGLQAALVAVQAHPLIAAGAAGLAIGTAWRKMVPEVDAAAQSVLGFIDKHTGLLGVYSQQQANEKQWVDIQAKWKEVAEQRAEAAKAADSEFKSVANQVDNATDSTAELTEKMRELGILVEAKKVVNVDTSDAKKKFQELEYWVGEGEDRVLKTIQIPVDTSEVEKAKESIDEIPAEKRFEIETNLNIAKLKEHSEIVQTAMEWEAKLSIANVEAETERVKAIAEGIQEVFKSTGEVIGSIFDSWNDEASLSKKWALQDSLAAEQDRRDRALAMQEELTKAQIANIEAKTEALKDGDAVLRIEGSNVSPHIEAFMWEILAALQIRATQEGLDALLIGG